jgi:hypothetical protein
MIVLLPKLKTPVAWTTRMILAECASSQNHVASFEMGYLFYNQSKSPEKKCLLVID